MFKSTRVSVVPSKKEKAMSTVDVKPAPKAKAKSEKAPKAPKEKVEKPLFPVPENKDDKIKVDPEKGFVYPVGYDAAKHRGLNGGHFFSKADYLEYRAFLATESAAKFRKEASEWRTKGPVMRAKKRAEQLRSKIDDLRSQLKELGLSDTEIEAMIAGK